MSPTFCQRCGNEVDDCRCPRAARKRKDSGHMLGTTLLLSATLIFVGAAFCAIIANY